MPKALKRGYKSLLAEAKAEIEEYSAVDAINLQSDPDIVIVDLRDPRELEIEGRIPGSFHCPRGMLEFWVDPESPYYKPVFGEGKKYVFHCAAGWRSALATKTVKDMGLTKVAHIDGGFKAWKEAGGAIETYVPKSHEPKKS
ncbi:MAG: rhodanese-like domain-containing protein [Hyphomicrobiaceae bacterium]